MKMISIPIIKEQPWFPPHLMVIIQEQKVNLELAIMAPYENGLGFTIFYEGALQENTIF
jgi:hypothetical protein